MSSLSPATSSPFPGVSKSGGGLGALFSVSLFHKWETGIWQAIIYLWTHRKRMSLWAIFSISKGFMAILHLDMGGYSLMKMPPFFAFGCVVTLGTTSCKQEGLPGQIEVWFIAWVLTADTSGVKPVLICFLAEWLWWSYLISVNFNAFTCKIRTRIWTSGCRWGRSTVSLR